MARLLVKTTTSGWFLNAADPDGRRVRKADDDTIVELDQVVREGDVLVQVEKAPAAAGQAPNNGGSTAAANAEKADVPVTVAETGRVLVGKTITVTCTTRGCNKTRTIKPQDRFQVKFCVEHQAEHRKAVRREKQRAKTKARREAREAAAVAAAVATAAAK